MKKGDKIILIEIVMDEEDEAIPKIYLDLLVMTVFGGKERTEKEYQALFEKAGLKLTRVIPTRTIVNIIEE